MDEGLRKQLLQILLEVYVGEKDAESEKRATRLLDAQGVNLEVVDVSAVRFMWRLVGLLTLHAGVDTSTPGVAVEDVVNILDAVIPAHTACTA